MERTDRMLELEIRIVICADKMLADAEEYMKLKNEQSPSVFFGWPEFRSPDGKIGVALMGTAQKLLVTKERM